jgi:transposase-like protein
MDSERIFQLFPSRQESIRFLEQIQWMGKPKCPYCGSIKSTVLKDEFRYRCNLCHTAYSVTVNTIFHDTRLPLQKWFLAIVLILSTNEKFSSRELARVLNVNKNTAWYLSVRIKDALAQASQRQLVMTIFEKLGD